MKIKIFTNLQRSGRENYYKLEYRTEHSPRAQIQKSPDLNFTRRERKKKDLRRSNRPGAAIKPRNFSPTVAPMRDDCEKKARDPS